MQGTTCLCTYFDPLSLPPGLLNTFLRFQIQESFGAHYDLVEMKLPEICPGSAEYQENIKFLKTTIAQLKTPEGAKAMQVINIKLIYRQSLVKKPTSKILQAFHILPFYLCYPRQPWLNVK